MNCERCGTGLPDNAAICPTCGTITSTVRPVGSPPTGYGQYSPGGYGAPQQQGPYGQGYGPQPGYTPPPNYGYVPQQNAAPMYQPAINVTVTNTAPTTNVNTGALIAEVILSLFGIYGVGWLMAGETTTGIILLICSFVVYYPVMILGTIFTLGIGLACLGPLAIAAIVVNAILLNNALKRKATQVVMVQTNPVQQQYPPRYPPYQ